MRLHLGIVGAKPSEKEIKFNDKIEDLPRKDSSAFESSHDFKAELDKSMKLHLSRVEYNKCRRMSRTAAKFPLSKSALGYRNYPKQNICEHSAERQSPRIIINSKNKPYGANSESSFNYVPFKNVSSSTRMYTIISQAGSSYKIHKFAQSQQYKIISSNSEYRAAISKLPKIFNRDVGYCGKTCDVRKSYGPLLKK